MNPWRWVDDRVRQVKVADLRVYLVHHGWVERPNPNSRLLRFDRADDGKGAVLFQMIPAEDNIDEYPQRMVEFLTTLSELEDRHPVAVLEDILQDYTGTPNGDTRRSTVAKK